MTNRKHLEHRRRGVDWPRNRGTRVCQRLVRRDRCRRAPLRVPFASGPSLLAHRKRRHVGPQRRKFALLAPTPESTSPLRMAPCSVGAAAASACSVYGPDLVQGSGGVLTLRLLRGGLLWTRLGGRFPRRGLRRSGLRRGRLALGHYGLRVSGARVFRRLSADRPVSHWDGPLDGPSPCGGGDRSQKRAGNGSARVARSLLRDPSEARRTERRVSKGACHVVEPIGFLVS